MKRTSKTHQATQRKRNDKRGEPIHVPVLYEETLAALKIKKKKCYIDATFGLGGHSKGILEKGGKVIGIEVDEQAIKHAARDLALNLTKEAGSLLARNASLTLVQGNFADIKRIVPKFGVWETPGIIFDLGLSSLQLSEEKRGFSFNKQGPLDMRMDASLAVTAADLINGLNQGELYDLFTKFGEEYRGRRIARAIVETRVDKKIETTRDLSEIIERCASKRGKIHPATRVFQALRIAVNSELDNLKKGLEGAVSLLGKEGRLVVISFHSLEDRIVKNFFAERDDLKILTKKPILPSKEEILKNPRSRSAKMRIAEKY
jgi:16S rRNA (cytosine1402-N4)-methyltransferase